MNYIYISKFSIFTNEVKSLYLTLHHSVSGTGFPKMVLAEITNEELLILAMKYQLSKENTNFIQYYSYGDTDSMLQDLVNFRK